MFVEQAAIGGASKEGKVSDMFLKMHKPERLKSGKAKPISVQGFRRASGRFYPYSLTASAGRVHVVLTLLLTTGTE